MKFRFSNEINNTVGDNVLQDALSRGGLTEGLWGDLNTLVENCVFTRVIPKKRNDLRFKIYSRYMKLPIKMVKNEYRLNVVE